MSENWKIERFLQNSDSTNSSKELHEITKSLNDMKEELREIIMKMYVLELEVASCQSPLLLQNIRQAQISASECSQLLEEHRRD